MDKHYIWIFVLFSIVDYTDAETGECTFPKNLQGQWEGVDDGKPQQFWFKNNYLKDFNYYLTKYTLERDNFMCYMKEETDQYTLYVLRSEKTTPIFTGQIYLYFCIAIQNDGNEIKYAIQTEKSSWFGDNLYGFALENVEARDVCNSKSKEMKPLKPKNADRNLKRLLDDLERRLDNEEREEHKSLF